MRALVLLVAGLLVLVLAGAAGGANHFAPSTPKQAYVTDGGVTSIVDTGSVTYIGGGFDRVGPRTGPAVALSATTGNVIAGDEVSGGSNTVYVVAPDGSGGYYVGGDFTHVGGLVRHDLAHILSNGSVDTSFDPEPSGDVMAIAVSGSTVYVGGQFLSIGGQSRGRIAALDSSGNALNWNPFANATVRAIAVSGGFVYAGGDFSSIGGASRFFVARVATSSNAADSNWDPHASSSVYAIVVAGSTIYLGGAFTAINQPFVTANRVAAVDNSTGALVSGWVPGGANNTVYTLAFANGALYVGGIFSSMNGQQRRGAASLDGETGSIRSWNPDPQFPVAALAVSGSTLYMGGSFSYLNNGTTPRNGLAAFNTSDDSLTGWDPNAGNEVLALAGSGSTVFAGGIFSSVNMIARSNLAAIDDSTGQVTSWDPEPNGEVLSLADDGTHVFAGGIFSEIGGQSRRYVAELDPNTGVAELSWNAGVQSTNGGCVCAIAAAGSNVYIGGFFTNVDGQSRNYLAKLDSTGAPVVGWNPGTNDEVAALALFGSTLYVGGAFSQLGGQTRHQIGAVDASSGALRSWDPEANNTVEAVAASSNAIYVGGDFTNVGGQARTFLAAIDPSTGLATSWNPSPDGGVQAIAENGPNVFVGGQFTTIGGVERDYLAEIDAGTGDASSFNPQPNNPVQTITGVSNRLDVGGVFTGFELGANQGFASFDLQPSLNVLKTGTGTGTVSSAPDGIFCGATCSGSFNPGTSVTLSAFPDAGSTFTGWSGGGCSGTGTCQITLNTDATVTATFSLPTPSISSLSPPKGSAGDTITVNGSSLSGATSVKLGPTPASFTQISANQLTFVVPNGASTGHVSVITPGGTAVSSGTFLVTAVLPSVTTFAPGQGAPGASISVKGFHLTGATSVTFGGTPAVFAVVTDNLITATVPVGAATGKIAVTTAGGTSSSPSSFTVLPAVPPVPTITSFSPGSGIKGVAVTIKGSGFTGATAVTFNGKAASFSVVNDTTIKTIVPFGATTGPISVTTPGGVVASAASFTAL